MFILFRYILRVSNLAVEGTDQVKTILRILIYIIVFVVVVRGTGAIGYVHTMNAGMSVYDKTAPSLTDVKVPKYDAN